MKNIFDIGIKTNDNIKIQKEKRQLNGLTLFSFLICLITLFPMSYFNNPVKLLFAHILFIIFYLFFFTCNITGNFKITKTFFIIVFISHITIASFLIGMINGLALILFVLTPIIAFLTNRNIIIFSIISILIFVLINIIWLFFPDIRLWFVLHGSGSISEIINTNQDTYYGLMAIIFALILLLASFVQTISISINKYEYELININKQKTNFFINLTHETKTPLTIIINYLDKHIKKYGITDEMNIIKQNLIKLQNDIINFMDIEKVERCQILYNHFQIINLSNTLNIKIMMFKEIANKKNISIKSNIDDNIFIKIDPSAIDRIINNLIDNSIKYTPEKGIINISLKKINDKIYFTIKDTGIGISKENQKHIYEPYYQITHEKRNIQGMGIGLYIVKKIIEEINGKIDVESELDKGTSFKITFKNHKLIEGEIVQENINYTKPIDNVTICEIKEPVYDENKNNILLIEDNINMLLYLQSNISEKYNVFCAVNGKEALDKLKIIPRPGLIISDIMMDIMDGMSFFEELNKKEQHKDIPFIFLTAKTSGNDKLQAILNGAIDYIYKPFNIEELLAKINSIIMIRESYKEMNLKEMEYKISNVIRTGNKQDIKDKNFIEKCLKYKITDKEQDTIKLLLDGLEIKEIGERLEIPLNTIKKRLSIIYKKCGIQNKIELFKIFN